MIKKILITLGILCVTIIILWFACPLSRSFFESLGSLFTLISSLLALTVFLNFYIEIEKAKNENEQKRKEEKMKFNSRMTALGSEIVNNIQLCDLFESERENHINGNEVPNLYFEYSVMSNMIINGDITYHKFRAELTSLILQMKSINNLILSQQQLMIFKNFAPTEKYEALKNRTINSMKLLHSKVPIIKDQLVSTQPLFEEFWENPDKFIDEQYLKEKMIPEALIR
jgi:fucose permease